MGVEASIVVVFDGDDDSDTDSASVSIELDEEHANNLDDEGALKSSFAPEDRPVILIHHADDVYIKDVLTTDGTVLQIGTNKTREKEKEALFTSSTTEVSVSYSNPRSLSAIDWRGNTNSIDFFEEEDEEGQFNIMATNSVTFPCVCTATFEVLFQQQWQLIPPSMSLGEDETYVIYIVVYMGEVK